MYKLLLCLCYLKTRFLAVLCVISLLLGVATLIVVNSVMSGFSSKMKSHMNGLTSDVVMQTEVAAGFQFSSADIEDSIRSSSVGQHVEAISPTVEVYAILQFDVQSGGKILPMTRHVKMIGIDPAKHDRVGKFGSYLRYSSEHPERCFELTGEAKDRFDQHRQWDAWDADDERRAWQAPRANRPGDVDELGRSIPKIVPNEAETPLPNAKPQDIEFARRAVPTIVLGYQIACFQATDPKTGEKVERQLLKPGDDLFVATVGASGTKPVSANFVVTDYIKTEMTEFDANVVYVPLEDLQRLRGMGDRANALQIRLKDGVREDQRLVHREIVPVLQDLIPKPEARTQSWWQLQGPIFAAIDLERGLLNILLFLIVGVAGFGVLAIFSMIVSEKVRDIGILKSLGASNGGVMAIFIGYGVFLGFIGCALGTAAGLAITMNINEIEQFLSKYVTGREVFDRKVYYFDKIPTDIEPLTVLMVNLCAMVIALASSILPAWRAARLQPVRALRFE